MKKVALYVISDGFAGAEQVVRNIIKNLNSKFELFLIINGEIAHFYKGILPEKSVLNIGTIYYHLNPRYRFIRYLLNNRFFTVKNLAIRSRSKQIACFIRKKQIQIIHVHLEYALYSICRIKASMEDLRIIYTVHSAFGLLEDKRLKPQVNFNMIDFAMVDNFVFVSKYVQNIYASAGMPIKNSMVIYNGISSDLGSGQISTATEESLFTILFVGGAKPVKGYDILVKAIEKLYYEFRFESFRVIVLGDVLPDSGFVSAVKESGIWNKFEFSGFIIPPKHLEYFMKAHILVMPSRTEALPMASIEALLLNIPQVVSNVGGLPEIVENDKNGYLCRPDPVDFADKIYKSAVDYSSLKTRTISYNKSIRERFSIENFCKDHNHLYQQLT